MNLQKVYFGFRANDLEIKSLLLQSDWFCRIAIFDPKTGEALPQALTLLFSKVAAYEPPNNGDAIHDRLWRITEHSRASVKRLFHALNESPRREQAWLPIHAVRELDANSFIKLSNRPGRTIREKLAGKPYLQAVRRFQSANLPENRLLKAFVRRLADLLEARLDCLGQEDQLLAKIQSWLRSDEAQAIGNWDNLPPNNTLLSHRDYRRVWDAWRWLQTIDEDIARDFSQVKAREDAMRVWTNYAQMWKKGRHHFVEMPILFDYERFEIRPWLSQLAIQQSKQTISRELRREEFFEPACIDLTSLRPSYATKGAFRSLRETYLWQQWMSDGQSVDIELFNADAAYVHANTTLVSAPDLFFSNNKASDNFDSAARSFASELRKVFKSDTLIWLVPDSLNDFELEIFRRNLNARFPDAEPLPRSVAAAFELVDYSRVTYDSYPIAIVDCIGGKTCVTKLLARFDAELKKRLPETNGLYWERCPPVIVESKDALIENGERYDIITVDGLGQWHDATVPAKSKCIDQSFLKNDPRIGKVEICITLTESPVVGGMLLHSFQQRARDIPLWRDQVSELSIKVMKDGRYQRFHLVTRGTTVKPIRGAAISIPVVEDFTLPAGKSFYQFPLFQGESTNDIGFAARLDSSAFKLKEDLVCKLNLTFEYGADEPYKLVFAPLDESFPPVRATWRKTEHVIITDAPSPEYPTPMTWADLKSWRDPQGKIIDLLEWLRESLSRLHELIPARCAIAISSNWRQKSNESGSYWFAFAKTEEGQECYCNTKHFSLRFEGDPNSYFPFGTPLFGDIRKNDGRVSAFEISTEINSPYSVEWRQRIILFKERSLQNRMSTIWGDARSLDDPTCPDHFKKDLRKLTVLLLENLPSEVTVNKFLFLLACMHKDAPHVCVQWITDQVNNCSVRDPRAVGFALGDVSEPWQEDVFAKLVESRTFDSLRFFAYAIWREQHFVDKFNFAQLQLILKGLTAMLGDIMQCPTQQRDDRDKQTVRKWVRSTAEPLELLLGLLRTRASSNSEIKMLLQPHQKVTKDFAIEVERVAEVVALSNVPIFSRVQINIQKPEGDRRTPDLLYALRLYLTGDDGANAIHITSVSDSDND
jgi:hypothetical protein